MHQCLCVGDDVMSDYSSDEQNRQHTALIIHPARVCARVTFQMFVFELSIPV